MKEIVLSNGVDVAFVDDEDYERIVNYGSWFCSHTRGKPVARNKKIVSGKTVAQDMARVVMRLSNNTGRRYPPERVINKDGNLLNNQKSNLSVIKVSNTRSDSDTIVCRKCGVPKSKEEFYYRKDSKTQRGECKGCLQKPTSEAARRTALKKKYKITPEQWDKMFESQGRCCAICKTTKETKRGWVTDHCHVTKFFRGVLCTRCNSMLGHSKDSMSTLMNGAFYLSRFQRPLEVT